MGCCNAKSLSKVVAALTIAFCIVAGILDITFLHRLRVDGLSPLSKSDALLEEIGLPYGVLIMVLCLTGFITSMLYIRGLQQESLRQMASFVYTLGGCITIYTVSTICAYSADLVTAKSYYHAFLDFIYNCLIIGCQILYCSPVFLTYQRMRNSLILPA